MLCDVHFLGTVTDLQFWASSHLFTCSEDGTLSVLKTGKWECLRTFKGHKYVKSQIVQSTCNKAGGIIVHYVVKYGYFLIQYERFGYQLYSLML